MTDENDSPIEPTLPDGVTADEMLARAMQSVRMTMSGTAHGWEPPSIEETARLFPGYEVLSLLGRGGMGAVYQARQIALDRLVAIKLLPLEVSIDPIFADRFRREARAMARLNHPNIIAVYDFGQTAESHLFIVMEYVEGANLHDIIHGVGLEPDQALSVVEQICAALGYAHGKGIVHRDIKPANVMIDTESHVKVADFGLARLIDSGTADLGHTVTGTVMGTPDYMAPEQTRGMNVDHRADIYSLGVMIYEMLCREVPKGIFQTPSVRTGCDTRIDAIVIKAMQQAPDHRYQSTQEMRADVTAARTPLATPALAPVAAAALPKPPPKPPPPKKPARPAAPAPPQRAKPRTALYAGIASLLVALIGGVIYFKIAKRNPEIEKAPSAQTSTPATATKAAPFVNSLGMKFVPVPGTQVLFSIWDTRVMDYAACAAAKPNVDGSWKTQQKDGVPVGREPDHPVVSVSWDDAQAFCRWLTEWEIAAGTLPKGAKYRLPTDAEWSIAVGLPPETGATPAEKDRRNKVDFPWGRNFPPQGRITNNSDESFHSKFPSPSPDGNKNVWINDHTDGYATTSPVGSFPANGFGLFDMGGNLRQWCEDWYDNYQKSRVLRGSGWNNHARDDLLSSERAPSAPLTRHNGIGFRCVLDLGTSTIASPPAIQPAIPTTPLPVAGQSTSPTKPAIFQGHSYQFVPGHHLWPEAKKKAEEMGGYLAVITSKEENDFAEQLLKPILKPANPNTKCWIGASQTRADTPWTWVSGEVMKFTAWGKDQPNRGGGDPAKEQHTVFLAYQLGSGGPPLFWNDLESVSVDDSILGFLVEWDDAKAAVSERPPSLETGFIPLFDGKTFANWSGYAQASPTADWRVADGVMIASGDHSFLVTKEIFGDFDLRLEWKVGPNGNGGIFFRVPTGEGSRPLSAPEFQLCSRDVKDAIKTGALYNVKSASEDASRPTGEWNTARLVAKGGHCEHWVNEKLVCSYDIGSDEWKKLMLASKFSNDPRYAQQSKGMIGLQSWTGEISYRNIRILALGGSPPSPSPQQPASSDAKPVKQFDLLALTDPVRDRVQPSSSGANVWRKMGEALSYEADGKPGKIASPVGFVAKAYEIEVAFRRKTVGGRFNIDLPVLDKLIAPLEVGRDTNKIVLYNGATLGTSSDLASALSGRIMVRVEPVNGDVSKVTVWFDGTRIGEWNGKLASIAKANEVHRDFPGQTITSLWCEKDSYEFTAWKLRVFDGEAKVLRPLAPATSSINASTKNNPWVVYPPKAGPGAGRHIVFLSGDEEYRSEESLPMLAKILSQRHGFKCTVLFAVDADGYIKPDAMASLPGAEALDSADAIVLLTRYRAWPDAQMKHFADAYHRGVPIIGLRTATHALKPPAGSSYASAVKFGGNVFGSGWVNHWGAHKKEATRGIIEAAAKADPILNGVADIFGNSDVYEVTLPPDVKVLVRGQVLTGMNPNDPPATYTKLRADKSQQNINNPMMPVAWTRTHTNASGRTNAIFCTTMGAATDLENEGLRRLVVNAVYSLLGLEVPVKADVDYVGEYRPRMYDFNGYKKGVKPADLALPAG